MQRVRLFRVLLPVFLVAFILVIGLTLKSRPPRTHLPNEIAGDARAHAEGFTFSDLVAGRRHLMVQARLGRVDNDGRFEVEEVTRVEIAREDQPPLVLTAARGAGAGPQGKRTMRLEGGVTFHDDETGLDLAIPTVEVDQVTGVVRSVGDVIISGPVWKGKASALVYSLNGLPAQVIGVQVTGTDGSELHSQRAVVEPKSRTITLDGDVDARQGGMTLRAPLVVLVRGPNGRIETATASSSVSGSISSPQSGEGHFTAREVRAAWAPDGKVKSVSLSGGAHIEHTRGEISADRIDAQADEAAGGYAIDATGQVLLSGPTKNGVGKLTGDAVRAHLGAAGVIRDGVATGNVTFEGEGTSGEAASATLTGLDADGSVTLQGSQERRARIANARTRIVADHVTSDVRGQKLVAQGRVESTLLPATGDKNAASPPMFAADEAVHFVSTSLESANSGARLFFRGDVRGWQGDRTLSADEVEMIQDGQNLNATGQVVTRMPRVSGKAASEADFIQVVSERLAYRGTAHQAEYTGSVRVRQAEGWLEAPRLVASLQETGHGVKDVQAFDGVRFEYRSVGERGTPTTATGEGDRAVYEADGRLLRLFGDKAPATVRNTGPSGGTTAGRVLRYHLDSGALEVESGERDRATIKTPKS